MELRSIERLVTVFIGVFLPHSCHASRRARSDSVFQIYKTATAPNQRLSDGHSEKWSGPGSVDGLSLRSFGFPLSEAGWSHAVQHRFVNELFAHRRRLLDPGQTIGVDRNVDLHFVHRKGATLDAAFNN